MLLIATTLRLVLTGVQGYLVQKLGQKITAAIREYNKNLINKIFIKQFKLKKTLFLSNWALSESPIYLRHKFLNIMNKTRLVFLAFQEKYQNINNLNYFKKNIKNKIYLKTKKFQRVNEKHFYLWNIN
jgi:hypothetical protein